MMEKLKLTTKHGLFPHDNDPIDGVFVLQNKRKIGFMYCCGPHEWRVYGVDLGGRALIFDSRQQAINWIYVHKPGLNKAIKARGLRSTYNKLKEDDPFGKFADNVM